MTTYGEKYRIEFSNDGVSPTLNVTPRAYRLRIWFPGFTGAYTALRPSSEPVTIASDGNQEDLFSPMLAAKAVISLTAEDFWVVSDLLVTEDQQVKVTIESVSGNLSTGFTTLLHWIGWLQPTDIKEKYGEKPYPVTLNAACGLSTLKTRLLLTADKKRLQGLVSVLSVLKTALSLTATGIPVVTVDNLYESQDLAGGQTTDGKADINRDPLDRVRIQAESLLAENSSSETISAYDALINELSLFGIRIAQVGGRWLLVRVVEAAGGWNVWDTDSESVNARVDGLAGTLNLTAFIGQGRKLRAIDGAITWAMPIVPAVLVQQKFGGYLNRLPNGDFSQIDSAGFPIGWQRNGLQTSDNPQRLGTGTDQDPYRLRLYGVSTNDVPTEFRAVTQFVSLPANSHTKELTMKLKGRFRLVNARSAMLWVTARTTPVISFWALQSDGSWVLNPKKSQQKTITISNVYTVPNVPIHHTGWQHEKAGWCAIELAMNTLSGIDGLNISLLVAESLDGQTTTPAPYIEYADMRLEIADAAYQLDGATSLKRLDITRKKPDASLTMVHGDVPDTADPGNRLGTMFKAVDAPTVGWCRPDADIINHPQQAQMLLTTILESQSAQRMKSALVWEGELMGELPYGIHSVLRFDDLLRNDGSSVAFIPTKYSWKLRSERHSVTAIELLTTAIPVGLERQWDTPTGPIPLETDNSDVPLPPTFPRRPRPFPLTGGALPGKFTLFGSSFPGKFTPVTPGSGRYTLVGEIAQNGRVIGRAPGILRLINTLPG